jgi:glycosyltransferase 2 family protein
LPNPERSGAGRARHALPALVGIVLSLALLAWAARGVRLDEVWRQIRAAHPLPLAVAVILATLTFPLRLIRWRVLLPDEDGSPYPVRPLWHAVALGFMANNLLPLRAGELVRTYTAARLAKIRFSTVLSSIGVERIFDALTVVALLSAALLYADLPPALTIGGASVARLTKAAGLVGCAALLAGVLVLAAPVQAERVVRALIRQARLSDMVVGFIEGIRQGLVVLRSPGRLLLVIFWSFVLWSVNALAFFVAFGAFDIHVSYWGALLMQGLLVLGISIPSTPGFFGPFEAVIVAVLALYAIPHDQAFSYAVSYHVTSFLPITILGLWSLARTPGGFRRLRAQEP